MNANGFDARAFQLMAQGFGEAAHGEFGGVVGALGGHGDQAEQTGDVDDAPFVLLEQGGQEGLGAIHHAPEVDGHDPLEVLIGHLVNGLRHCHTGVVDDDVGGAELLLDRFGVGVEILTARHVQLLHVRAGGERGGGLGQAHFVHIRDGKLAALLVQLLRQRSANARTRTGDDCDLVLE